MALPIRIETRTGDTPASKRQRQRRDPPDILLTTPEQLALLLATADAPYLFGSLRARRARRTAFAGHQQARRPAVARPGAAVRAGAGRDQRRPVGDRRRAGRPAPLSGAAARGWRGARRPGRWPSRAPRPTCASSTPPSGCRGPDIPPAMRSTKSTTLIGRTRPRWCSSTPAARPRCIFQELWRHQRRRPADRAASRLARRRAAPQGRGRDGGRHAARGGRDLVARSRHRLGRRRSRHQCRRAEGRVAAAAAHRPRQPPDGRALEGAC